MKITIQLPNTIGQELLGMPDPDAFVGEAVARALKRRPAQKRPVASGESKWAKIARRVSEDPNQLGDYYPQFEKDMREFRESFSFKHDEDE